MTTYIALGTATLLSLLAIQAEPISATIGFIWAGVHVVTAVREWYAD